jgi:hypothetical protein
MQVVLMEWKCSPVQHEFTYHLDFHKKRDKYHVMFYSFWIKPDLGALLINDLMAIYMTKQ